jgi:hypothetical protein
MYKPIRPRLAVALLCTSLVILWLSTSQLRSLTAAQQHVPIIIRALAPYPEFKNVKCGTGSGFGGNVAVYGYASDTDALTRLKTFVMTTHPPVRVRFLVRVSNSQPPSR